MTAKKGTHSFTSEESYLSEKSNREIFKEVLNLEEFKDDFETVDSYSINEIYGSKVACTPKGEDSLCYPDFGLISYKGKYVAMGDNKYQSTKNNAIERVNLYSEDIILLGIKPKNLFLIFDGPAFDKDKNGNYNGSVGKQIVRSSYKHTVLVQPSKKELYDKVYDFFKRIKKEEDLLRKSSTLAVDKVIA